MPITTVPANDRRESFTASGGQTVFTFDFPIYAAGDILVTRVRLGAETTLALTVDYTVTGAGNQAGGSITLTSGALAGDAIILDSNQASSRSSVFTNGGDLPATVLNDDFNRAIIALQQLERGLGRSIRLTPGDAATSMVLPPVVDRAGKTMTFDSLGNVAVAPGGSAGGPLWNTGSNVLGGSLGIAGTQAATATPSVNPIASLSSLVVEATTAAAAQREFMASFNFISNLGAAYTGTADGDKVALFVGMEAQPGTGDVWAFNSVLTMQAASGSCSGQGIELDFNNLNAHRGDGIAGAGLSAPVAYGMSITGASSFRSTAAFGVFGPGTGVWNRGMVFGNASVVQATFQDLTNSTTSIEIFGTHTHGIDGVSAVTTNFLRMANNARIAARNAANSAELALISLNASNEVVLGGTGIAAARLMGSLLPVSDNTITLGASGQRFSAVWAANGTIQTSDARLKTDIAALPDCLSLIAEIEPKTYRWIHGGFDEQQVTETRAVQATKWREWDEPGVEMRDGIPIQVPVRRRALVELYDEMPVLDEAGAPVMIDVPARPARFDQRGRQTRPARAAQRIPLTHRVPRMERRQITETQLIPRPGRRTHWGFLASEVAEVFNRRGLDFGGYVSAEDGQEGLRMDQMVPILWRAVQQQQEQIESLREQAGAAIKVAVRKAKRTAP